MNQVPFSRAINAKTRGVILAAVIVACCGGGSDPASAIGPGRTPSQFQGSTSSHRPVSPTVLASWLTRGGRLTLLVLWRGSPGWFWRADGGGDSGGGNGQQAFQEIREGGLTFRIDYDFRIETATVHGHSLSLRDTNVVIMDRVDSLDGPVVLESRYVNALLPEPLSDAGLTVLQREPDLHPFLECDRSLPASPNPIAPLLESLITSVCQRIRGR